MTALALRLADRIWGSDELQAVEKGNRMLYTLLAVSIVLIAISSYRDWTVMEWTTNVTLIVTAFMSLLTFIIAGFTKLFYMLRALAREIRRVPVQTKTTLDTSAMLTTKEEIDAHEDRIVAKILAAQAALAAQEKQKQG